ncbi:SHOCT domain-containing protein [Leuconostoc gelidum]|uniref:SHOCT domain-containing protein n=1 Tax=Leuconostoc gelidum TaxID=1244 RepID=UPI001CC3A57D|nr:SHOCT domain-containing protein [Leuconostoc gelidum]MBZ6000916.1 SHOCT domain-containing protein [Leuconostoc gelidum subsp. gelidum]
MGLLDGIKKDMQLAKQKSAIEKQTKLDFTNHQKQLKNDFIVGGKIGLHRFNDDLSVIKLLPENAFMSVYVEYKNIKEVHIEEVVEEKTNSKNKGKRKGVLTRAVVGTVLMPGVGTVVGGLTAKKENNITTTTTKNVKRTIVLIQDTPFQSLLTIAYDEALFSKLGTILSNKKVEETKIDGGLNDLSNLKQLLDDGVITQEDFDAKKKQILGI